MPPDPPSMARTYKSYKAPGTRPPPPNISWSVRHCCRLAASCWNNGHLHLHFLPDKHSVVLATWIICASLSTAISTNSFFNWTETNKQKSFSKLSTNNPRIKYLCNGSFTRGRTEIASKPNQVKCWQPKTSQNQTRPPQELVSDPSVFYIDLRFVWHSLVKSPKFCVQMDTPLDVKATGLGRIFSTLNQEWTKFEFRLQCKLKA